MLKSKRGSHVGVVISFVLFIVFIVFMYVILDYRVQIGEDKKNSLSQATQNSIEEVSGNLTAVSIGLSATGNCVQLVGFFTQFPSVDNKIIIVNDSETTLTSSRVGNDLFVQRDSAVFFRVYESPEFSTISSSPMSSCDVLNEGNSGDYYSFGLSKKEMIVFESKIFSFLTNYTTNYENLKKNLSIGANDEFGFIFSYGNGTQILSPERNISLDVYSSRSPIQYFRTYGGKEEGFLDILLW